jgi:hypothetical protein
VGYFPIYTPLLPVLKIHIYINSRPQKSGKASKIYDNAKARAAILIQNTYVYRKHVNGKRTF